MRLLPLLLLLSACADPYLNATVKCVENAPTREAADACRAKLHDAGAPAQKGDGGSHG